MRFYVGRNRAPGESSFLDIERIKERGPFPAGKMRALLTGSDVTYPELMDQIDDAGFRIIRDDLSLGERYFATLIPEDINPIDALAKYYLNIPKPATKLGMRKRINYLLNAIEVSSLDIAISQNVKFCEPYAYDAVITNH